MPHRRDLQRRGLHCAGCLTAAAGRLALEAGVSLCASVATLAVVVLCFLLVHYQVPENRTLSDLLMFGAGALLAALFRAHSKRVRHTAEFTAQHVQKQWDAAEAV